MEWENQGMEVSESPAASAALCITFSYVTPGCRGEHRAQHPALSALGGTYALGCVL